MGRSSYRKFMKQERAKVKLKDKDKKLLPKGQNVTDLNFKVKKIVIKTQLKEHQQDEVLSSRKLNIQEVLSRLNHYSASVSTEAVSQLESLLKTGGQSFLSVHLTAVVSGLSKLLTSPHSHLRKSSVKLLASVFLQMEANEWSVLCSRVVSYIVCGLSHVEPGVRNNALLALEALPASFSLPADTLLPPLLDLVSTSRPAGSRSLNTPLSQSPTVHRTSVLQSIRSVLSSLPPAQDRGVEATQTNCEETQCCGDSETRVPLMSSYPLGHGLSISEFSLTSTLSSSSLFDLKEFASSLIPLMLDSFAETAPEQDDNEPVCSLSEEGLRLLTVIADVLLLLYDRLPNSQAGWMKEKFGKQIYKRVITGRFPYGEEIEKKKQQRGGKPGRSSLPSVQSSTTLRLNLTLALLAQTLVPQSASTLVENFLTGVLRSNLGVEEANLFERCLSASLSGSKTASRFLASLTRVKRGSSVHKEVFSALSRVLLTSEKKEMLSDWLESLVQELSDPDAPLFLDTLELLRGAAPLLTLPPSFHSAFPLILKKATARDEKEQWIVASLLYWVTGCQLGLLDMLQSFITEERSHCQPDLASHITDLLKHKCERYPEAEMSEEIRRHGYWSKLVVEVF